jgi:hypothetical protein
MLFLKIKNRTGRQNRSCLESRYQWEQGAYKKEGQSVDMVEIFCTHLCKWKNETC